MKNRFNEVRWFYKMIEITPNLQWLPANYSTKGESTVAEYQAIKSYIRATRWVFTLIGVMLMAGAVFAGVTLHHSAYNGTVSLRSSFDIFHFVACILGISLSLAGFMALASVVPDLLDDSIRARWKTWQFSDDIVQLLNYGFGNIASELILNQVHYLAANGSELDGAPVPSHVKQLMEDHLVAMIRNSKRTPEPGELVVTKADINSFIALLKKFSIIIDHNLKRFYKLAEKTPAPATPVLA